MSRDILPALRAVQYATIGFMSGHPELRHDDTPSLAEWVRKHVTDEDLLAIAERATSDPAPACHSCADLRSRLAIALDYERRLRAEEDTK